ncbi:ABC transporter substrate-binding protein [Gammaproteobacteria bacterium]|nr:ABC transporter substrate-binding protein [Gammaproteobacteria bacterium]
MSSAYFTFLASSIRFALTIILTLACSQASAQNASPTAVVQAMVGPVLSMLKDPNFSVEEAQEEISATVKKAFDSRAVAQSVLSTNWRQASKEQQDEFELLFAEILENTYIGRLEAYTNEVVEYSGEDIRNNRSTVNTLVITESADIPVNYKLRLRSDGWFIYDVEIENVSMVSSYRETYRSVVRSSGMDGLLTQMRDKIAELEQ